MRWTDDGYRYGRITRLLHWVVAALLTWQFAGMAIKLIVGRAPITAFWVGTHKGVGTMLMVLILVRAAWGLYNMARRPGHGGGLWGLAAKIGHLALYGLMLVVPAIALLRQYGSGKPLEVFGATVLNKGGAEIGWMTAPANAAHGLLAWVLLAAIAGHIAMVLVHRYVWNDGTTRRMLG